MSCFLLCTCLVATAAHMASFVQVPVFKINERLERSKIAAEEICEVFADFGHGNEVMGQQLSECAGRYWFFR